MSFKRVRQCTMVVLGLLFLSVTAIQAQVLPKFGVKGGLNYSTFNNTDNAEYMAGFIGGVYANVKVPATPMEIQPELLYAQYGSNFEDTDWKMSVDYVQVPVLAKFGFGAPEIPFRPKVFFGPYVGFKVASEAEGPNSSVDPDDFFESTDAGVAVGAGLSINRLNIDFRYTAGLSKVIADPSFEDNQKNGAFSLTLSLKL